MMKNILALLFVSSILVAGGDEKNIATFRGPTAKEDMSKLSTAPSEAYAGDDCLDRCCKDSFEFPCTLFSVPATIGLLSCVGGMHLIKRCMETIKERIQKRA